MFATGVIAKGQDLGQVAVTSAIRGWRRTVDGGASLKPGLKPSSRIRISLCRTPASNGRCGRPQRRLHDLLQAQSIEQSLTAPTPASNPGDILKLNVKARLRRVGREMKLVVHNAEDQAQADPGLLRIVARAHDFQERLIQYPDLTVPSIASQERLTIGYLSRLLRLPSLAPDIVTAIINGKHPPELSAKRLMRLALKLPTDWTEQRKLLGFQGE